MKLILEEWKKFLKEVDVKPMPRLNPPQGPEGPKSLKIDMRNIRTAIDRLDKGINDMSKSDHDNHRILQQLALFAREVTDAADEGLEGPNHEKIANDIKQIRANFGHMPTLDQRGPHEVNEVSNSSMDISKLVASWISKIVGNEYVVELGKLLATKHIEDPSLSIATDVDRIFENYANRIVEEMQQLAEDTDIEPTAHAAALQARGN
jgi:hypothetical protein